MGAKRSVKRGERVPLTGLRQKLFVDKKYKKPGYVCRWFNDQRSKLEDAENAWWAYVTDDVHVGEGEDGKDKLSTKVRQNVGTKESGEPLYAYLMEIQEKFYKEDEAARDKHLDATDNAIRRGEGAGGGPGQDGKYVPPQGIKYESRLD